MRSFIKNNISFTEAILIIGGLFFFISVAYVAKGGGLTMNYFAKIFYIAGTLMFIFNKN